MASSETNKELLNFEEQRLCSPETRLIICDSNSSLPRKSKKKEVDKHVHGSGPAISACSKSQVLGKVKSFLQEIAQANKQLEEKPQINCDMEALSGNETEIIEMDLLLGVAELQTPEALEAAEAAVCGLQHWRNIPCSRYMGSDDDTEDSSDDDTEDSSDDDTEDSSDENDDKATRGQEHEPNSTRPLAADKPRKKSKIVILN